LFGDAQNTELSLHPDLVRSILINLETSQKELEEMKAQLLEKDQEIEVLKERLATGGGATSADSKQAEEALETPISLVLSEVYRLGDYLARGHQLITLLVGQGRTTPQVQEAMRRVDWSHVVTEGPQTVKRIVHGLQGVQNVIRGADHGPIPFEASRPAAHKLDEKSAPLFKALQRKDLDEGPGLF
jgi:hypothetical protein